MINNREVTEAILKNVKAGKIDSELAFHIIKNLTSADHLSNEKIRQNDIAVIGVACRFAGAENKRDYWRNIVNGRCSLGPISSVRKRDIDNYFENSGWGNNQQILPAGYLTEIDKFDAEFFNIPPREAASINPVQRIFFESSYETFEDAGYGGNLIYNSRTGVYVGIDNSVGLDYGGYFGEHDILTFIGSYSSMLANRISYHFNLTGPAMVIDTACSSGLVAFHQAAQGLINQECDMALAGGINLFFYRGESALSGVESKNHQIKVFDKNANGTIWGEGVGTLLLKPLTTAMADHDNIYGVIKGGAINSDGASNGMTAPNAEAQTALLVQAWNKAGIDPSTIDYIETHGTGTVLGDPIEIKGLRDAFYKYTKKRQFCAINSVKNNIGHTCGASGLASLIKVILALGHKQIPANINFDMPNPYINFLDSPVYVNDRLVYWEKSNHPRRAGVSAFGLSGTNCHVVIEEAPERSSHTDDNNRLYLLTISAQYQNGVYELSQRYLNWLDDQTDFNLTNLCITANTGRGHYSHRLMLIFSDVMDLRAKLQTVMKAELEETGTAHIYYGEHKRDDGAEDKLAFISNDINKKIEATNGDKVPQLRLLEEIARSYVSGAEISWAKLYQGQEYQKISLPVYPYQKKRCWTENIKQTSKHYTIKANRSDRPEDQNEFYNLIWVPKKLTEHKLPVVNDRILVLTVQSDECPKLIQMLRNQGKSVIEVSFGEHYQKISNDTYVIGNVEADYLSLMANFVNSNLTQIIHFQDTSDHELKTQQQCKESLQKGTISVFYLIRALLNNHITEQLDIVLIANNVYEVTKMEQQINPLSAAMFGLGRVVSQEHPNFSCRCIDIDGNTQINEIIRELSLEYEDYQVAYRNGQRFVQELQELDLNSVPTREIKIKRDGVYIITGGTGGIGLEMGKYLAGKEPVKLALLNRSLMPARKDWDLILSQKKDPELIKKIIAVQNMETNGTEVICYSVDVSEEAALKEVLHDLRQRYGSINGIIHSAGMRKHDFIKDKDELAVKAVLTAKMAGTWLLDKLTEQDQLDFFILFSSVASFLGGAGQGDYSAANAFLDAYALYRSRSGRDTLSINWPTWRETGMAANNKTNQDGIFKTLSTFKALEGVEQISQKKISSVVIGTFNKSFLAGVSDETLRKIKITNLGLDKYLKNNKTVSLRGGINSEYSYLEQLIADIWGGILGLDEIHIDTDFFELGGNSIRAIQMEVVMEQNGLIMSYDDLKNYSTIRRLAIFFNPSNHQATPIMIAGIKPFNGIFYKDCFYNSLFPVINYFSGDIGYFLANDMISYQYYKYIKDPIKFEIKYSPVQEETDIYRELDICCHDQKHVKDIITQLTLSISDGRPVIIWIDCFYLPIRSDVYHKEHLPHTLLVYGYHAQTKVFHIIEHRHKDNLSYEEKVVSYDDLLNCYYGYLKSFGKTRDNSTYYEYYADDSLNPSIMPEHQKTIERYVANMLGKQDILIEGIGQLELIINDLKLILSEESTLNNNLSQFVKKLNDVINAKQIEKYRLIRFFPESTLLLSLLEEVIASWNSVRSIVVKYMFSSLYRKTSIENSAKQLDKIPMLEYQFMTSLLDHLNKYQKEKNECT
ncbi:SDR family NAD(P)-dependent oxidoreductase [Lacrimispora brassicae]